MIPVISVENMRKSDAYTIDKLTSGRELMWRAAEGIYNSVSWHGRVCIICGTGNNAGDGYALALILKEKGIRVEIISLKNKFSSDGRYYFEKCQKEGICVDFWNESTTLEGYDIVVDCILGTGFVGTPDNLTSHAIEAINKSGAYIVSADINSGLNGDTGMAEIAVKSDITVSIGTLKTGHVLAQASDYIKELKNVDIGIQILEKPYHLIEAEDCSIALKPRKKFSHKGSYGYATLIGGCTEYSGAIRLANMALSTLRSGAGVVRLATAGSISRAIMPHLLESTLYRLSDTDGDILFVPDEIDGALNNVKAVAIGMGIGQRAQSYEIIAHILKNYEIPVIIDADGLNALSRGDMSILKSTRCTPILTPHPAEFARLSGVGVKEMLESPIEHARTFAKEYGVILLLKGATTIVTDGNEVYLINRGCAGMATAGSGDVLCGALLGLCAQNSQAVEQISNVFAGAYINGLAGELAEKEHGEISMLSSDTVSKIPQAIRMITSK
ncbi:MAG: NAD(P)H-hydrate dehydratase [Clostridia bacterium]|nr:NAD(P)H-hydrate dehydratase [Clostridia bacterium]